MKTDATYAVGAWNDGDSQQLVLGNGLSSTYKITLDGSDGSITAAGNATFNGEYVKATGYHYMEPTGNAAAIFAYGTDTSSTSAIRISPSSDPGNTNTILLNFDGSASFAGTIQSPAVNVLSSETSAGTSYFACSDEVGGYSSKIIFYSGGSASFAGKVTAGSFDLGALPTLP